VWGVCVCVCVWVCVWVGGCVCECVCVCVCVCVPINLQIVETIFTKPGLNVTYVSWYSPVSVMFSFMYAIRAIWKTCTCMKWQVYLIKILIIYIYSGIQKYGLNFVLLYFLNCTWYMNDLHTIWKKTSRFLKMPLESSASTQPCSSAIWEQNGYYAAQDFLHSWVH